MKRYQCTRKMDCFTMGRPYDGYDMLIGYDKEFATSTIFFDDFAQVHEITPTQLENYFHEVPVEDYAVDQDEKHVYPTAAPGISTGCAIVAVFVLTVIAIAFAIVNEMAG